MMQRDPLAEALPRELNLEVTNRCNSHCQTCIRTFQLLEPPRDLGLAEFRSIVDQFSELKRVVLHGIGEPLLNAALPRMIGYIKVQHPGVTVLFNSNAVLLDDDWQRALVDAGLDEFRVSLDAATAAIYAEIRGIDAFGLVTENVRRFSSLIRNGELPRLSIWLTAMRQNLTELPALVDLAADIGVPEVYVQRLVLMHRGLARQEQSLYGRLRAKEESALVEAAERAGVCGVAFRASGLSSPGDSLRGSGDGHGSLDAARDSTFDAAHDWPWLGCYRMWRLTYITANGNVLPCCISPFSAGDYASLVLGNVFETPFAQIWNAPKYVERRASLYTPCPSHPCELCGVRWSL